jgi:hypothetical protein
MEIRTKKAGREFEALLFDFIFVDHRCDVKAPRRADDGFSIFSHDRSSRMNSPCGNLNDMGRQTSIHLFCPCNCPQWPQPVTLSIPPPASRSHSLSILLLHGQLGKNQVA